MSSVSLWTRDIELTEEQKKALVWRVPPKANTGAAHASKEKARALKASSEQEAREQWAELCGEPGFAFGLALYVGEGRKGDDGNVSLANTDARVLRTTLRFFKLCGIPQSRLRVFVQIPEGGHSPQEAMAYWSEELGLPLEQFVTPGKVPRRKKGNKYPDGVCSIRVGARDVKHKLNVWMDLALNTY